MHEDMDAVADSTTRFFTPPSTVPSCRVSNVSGCRREVHDRACRAHRTGPASPTLGSPARSSWRPPLPRRGAEHDTRSSSGALGPCGSDTNASICAEAITHHLRRKRVQYPTVWLYQQPEASSVHGHFESTQRSGEVFTSASKSAIRRIRATVSNH